MNPDETKRQGPLSADEVGTLQGTEYDEELGRRMAADARRVSDGELSADAFYEKYHEDVVAEFGRDDRPIDTGSDT